MTKWIAAALAALLIGCGGGSDDDERASTDPVDCRANPQMCQ